VYRIIGSETMRESRFTRRLRAEQDRETRQALLLVVLDARFGAAAAAEFAAAVRAVADVETLAQLQRVAILCATLDEFRSALTRAGQTYAH
jgi:hypothetical protein